MTFELRLILRLILFLVKEKSELLMQIEELNEVKEQVRENLWLF